MLLCRSGESVNADYVSKLFYLHLCIYYKHRTLFRKIVATFLDRIVMSPFIVDTGISGVLCY